MEEQIKTVESITQKQQVSFNFSQNEKFSEINKTYDQCDLHKGLVSISMKLLPILIYLLLKLMTEQQLSLFIIICLLQAVDFWTTKNILGPKLVGLKWFSIQDQSNNQKWCFASCSQNRILSKLNSAFFWIPQFIAIIFWIVIILINIITLGLFWVALASYSALLLILNLAFFLECKGDHQNQVNSLTKRFGFELYHKEQNHEQSSIA